MKFLKGILRLLILGSLFIVVITLYTKAKQEPVEAAAVQEALAISYNSDWIPISNKRPGTKRHIEYIVIHNTANPDSSAANEISYLTNASNTSSTSFHIAVDDKEIIEAIPVTELAFHAGDSEGNQKGIGIEICESGDYQKAEENAAWLVAYLMRQYDIPITKVKTHKDFSGKECPRKILGHWDGFINQVEKAYEQLRHS